MSALIKLLRRSEVRWGLVGVANTLFGLSVIFALKWSGFADVPANALGYACGLLLSFTLNSRWTFDYRGSALPALVRFILVIAVSYLANLGTVVACIQWVGMNSYLAQAMGIVPYTVMSYLGSKTFAFRG